MKKTIQQKRLDFLNETVNHYNINNRCAVRQNGLNNCRYSPKSLGLAGKSQGCAIGRHLTKKLALTLDQQGCSTVIDIINRLPKKLQTLGGNFLQSVQDIHDYSGYWDEQGLNNNGKTKYNQLIDEYCTE